MILIVVGLLGSGKSTVAQILRDDGFDVIELGDIWRELLKKNGISLNDPRATREFTRELREREGKNVYARYALERVKNSMKHVVIMGVRSTYEMDYFREHIREIKTIAIISPLETRFERLKMRGKPEDPKSMKDFLWLENREKRGFMSDKREEKHGVAVLIENADYTVSNTETQQELKKNMEDVIEKIKKKEGKSWEAKP